MVDTGYNSGGQHFDRSAHSLHIFKDGNLTVHSLRDTKQKGTMKIIRVFPTKTNASPDDELVYFGDPTLFAEADEIHISVSFTWDIDKAQKLAERWSVVAPVKIGGPATGMRGEEFISGKYLKKGYTVTSRGCPNKCWFCSVWRREGNEVRELSIVDGWNVLDDNLLACSEKHIRAVFEMLKRQKKLISFTGGFEAARLKDWHVELLTDIKLKQVFFAYDTKDDFEPLMETSKILKDAGIIKGSSHKARCYVLAGYPKDTMVAAEARLQAVAKLGFMPWIMLYRDDNNCWRRDWREFRWMWSRHPVIAAKTKALMNCTFPER